MRFPITRRGFGSGLFSAVAVSSLPYNARATDKAAALTIAIRDWLTKIVDNGWVSGASVRVVAPATGTLTVLHGEADREAHRPLAEDTIYRIYSMTKPITASAMMTLIERGTVQLDQPVAEFLPEFANPRVFVRFEDGEPVTEPAKRPILIRHLLTHTSGLSESFNKGFEPTADIYQAIGLNAGQFRPTLGIKSLADYTKVVATIPLAFQPGTRWLYGSSLEVAGRVIEVASGQDFASYLHDHILAPLKMPDTGFALPAAKQPRLAAMYRAGANGETLRLDAPLIPAWNVSDSVIPMGGSGLFSTLGDYNRFVLMLLGQGMLDGVRVLKPETVSAMMTNQLPPALGSSPLSQAARFGLGGEVTGLGFGFGGSVMVDPAAAGSVGYRGEYAWGGAASTTFWADPVNQIGVVLMTQKLPSGVHPLRDQLRRIIYAALP